MTKATYGELDMIDKCMDVTAEIQSQVQGRLLTVGTDVSLDKLFRVDPSPGRRKQLRIAYVTKVNICIIIVIYITFIYKQGIYGEFTSAGKK